MPTVSFYCCRCSEKDLVVLMATLSWCTESKEVGKKLEVSLCWVDPFTQEGTCGARVWPGLLCGFRLSCDWLEEME